MTVRLIVGGARAGGNLMRETGNLVVVTLAVVALVASVSCSRTATLDGAKVDIPIFSPSSLDDEHTATTSDDFHNIDKFSTHNWEFSAKAGWAAVDAFYREKLPSAQRDDETSPVAADESPLKNEVRFTWIPAGWTGGAKVIVLIEKEEHEGRTRFRLIQDVLKH
jgi:hypothetical protein